MAAINLSLSKLFLDVFGYKSTAFDPKFKDDIGNSGSDVKGATHGVHGAPYYATDANGREYYMPVTMTWTEITASGIEGGDITEQKSLVLPYPVISVNGRKTIIETALTERRGSVKELINIMDYDIVISGFAIAKTNEYPESVIRQLKDLYERNIPIGISSVITDVFLLNRETKGTANVVIKELNLPEVRGVKNVRPYQMVIVSDAAFNLVEIE